MAGIQSSCSGVTIRRMPQCLRSSRSAGVVDAIVRRQAVLDLAQWNVHPLEVCPHGAKHPGPAEIEHDPRCPALTTQKLVER